MSRAAVEEALAGNVRAYRARLRLSGVDLAARMRSLGFLTWTHPTVSEVEHNRRNVTVAELVALTEVLRVTIEQLLDESWLDEGPQR